MKKKLIKYSLGALFVLATLVIWRVANVGAFRTIENNFNGTIEKEIALTGAEDFALDRANGLLFISATDRSSKDGLKNPQNGLYLMNMNDLDREPVFLNTDKDLNPHGISMYKIDSSSYKIFVVNHFVENEKLLHSIEVFLYDKGVLQHQKTHQDPLVFSPNDVVAIDENRFYFTNDHGAETPMGRIFEDYLALPKSHVIYYDGASFKKVAEKISYANGINIDEKRQLMFVASPSSFKTKVYQIQENGDLDFIENILCGTGVDNIEFDETGTIWIGCHPKLLTFAAYQAGKKPIAPSELITIDYRGKGDYTIESVYENDGSAMSGSTVAVQYNDLRAVGNVTDDHFLILRMNR